MSSEDHAPSADGWGWKFRAAMKHKQTTRPRLRAPTPANQEVAQKAIAEIRAMLAQPTVPPGKKK